MNSDLIVALVQPYLKQTVDHTLNKVRVSASNIFLKRTFYYSDFNLVFTLNKKENKFICCLNAAGNFHSTFFHLNIEDPADLDKFKLWFNNALNTLHSMPTHSGEEQ